ncbi:MAG TPA: tetratricopeptide repeat protein [bacterium]|nr:tetratricopeptide repeat protein [bacterium]
MEERILRNIQKFAKRIKRDRFAKVYAPLADSYRRVGLFEDGIDTCRLGLEIFPRYLACHEVLGKVYLRQGKLSDARRELEQVAQVITDNLELSKALAKVYAKVGERDKAENLLGWIIDKDPLDFEMRNIGVQLRRDAERAQAREAGADPEELDLYDLAGRIDAVVNIEDIVAGETGVGAYDRRRIAKATDATLDGLENLEELIDAEADKIADATDEAAPRPLTDEEKAVRKRRREMLNIGIEELNAAAVIARVELEISLLDEASILCAKLLKKEPDDDELKVLAEKFTQRLAGKEAELDRLEGMQLGRGL